MRGEHSVEQQEPFGQHQSFERQETAARALVLRTLTAGPRTRYQLEQLLNKRGVNEQISRGLLDRFTQVGLVDDAAFAQMWVSSRLRSKKLARPALERELANKGVDPQVAQLALRQCDEVDGNQQARSLVQQRLPSCAHHPRQVQVRRLVNYLQRKGYDLSLSVQVVNDVLDEQAADFHGDDAQVTDDDKGRPLASRTIKG